MICGLLSPLGVTLLVPATVLGNSLGFQKEGGLELDCDAAALDTDNISRRPTRKRVLLLVGNVELAVHRIANNELNRPLEFQKYAPSTCVDGRDADRPVTVLSLKGCFNFNRETRFSSGVLGPLHTCSIGGTVNLLT
jgi:hypothetical protein